MLRDAIPQAVVVDGGRVADPVSGEACLHASCVALAGAGVVLLGPSGSGKSDLALRLIEAGGRLVADDRLIVERCGGQLIGRPPAALAGLIEARGLGIMRVEHCASAPLRLIVELGEASLSPRLPERRTSELLGIALPCVRLDPQTPSACARIKLALGAERVA
jgi:HPr kinase/phosphorylase